MRRRSYAIWWNEGNGPKHVGKLEIARLHALLSGNGSGGVAVLLYQITAVEWQRGEVLVTRKAAPVLQIGSLDAPGASRAQHSEPSCSLGLFGPTSLSSAAHDLPWS